MKKYKASKLAELFPPMDADDKAKLKQSIQQNGQLEPIVIYDGKDIAGQVNDGEILDGVNRYEVVTDLGSEPTVRPWSKMPAAVKAQGPLAYVMAQNLARRHLNSGQKAIVAAESLPLFEAEAKTRQSTATPGAPIGAKVTPGDDTDQSAAVNPEDESQAPTRKKAGEKKGKAAAAAAKAFGTSTRQVERASKLIKTNPKKAAAVKAGKTTLNKASKDVSKEAAAAEKLKEAFTRITKVCGKNFGAAALAKTVLKGGKKEVLEFAGMSDADMTKCQSLLERGWPLKKASSYKMTALTPKNTLRELGVRALSQGVAKTGTFDITMSVEGVALTITVKAAKAEGDKPKK